MNKCCWDLITFLLFIVNFASFIFVGLALGVGIWALVDSRRVLGFDVETDLSPDNPTALYFSLLLIFVVVFGFLLLFTFLGCCGAACQNQCMLGSFCIILLAFLGANIGGIIYLSTQFNNETELLVSEMKKLIAYYKADDPDSMARQLWDWLQPNLRCCGVRGMDDWSRAELKTGRRVPASCCLEKGENDMMSDCVYNPSFDNGAFTSGCIQRLEIPFRIIFWTIPSLMGVMLLFALIVCSKGGRHHALHNDHNISPPRSRHQKQDRSDSQISTGYTYPSSTPSAPPYNPPLEEYPMGVIAPSQPLIHPPPYHEVAGYRA